MTDDVKDAAAAAQDAVLDPFEIRVLAVLAEKELKRTGEFVIPGMVKLVLKKTNARTGRNPATGQPIPIAAKTVVKARIVKQLKDAVLPKKPA